MKNAVRIVIVISFNKFHKIALIMFKTITKGYNMLTCFYFRLSIHMLICFGYLVPLPTRTTVSSSESTYQEINHYAYNKKGSIDYILRN